MNVKVIDEKKQVGDYKTVARMLGMSTESVRQAWYRKEGDTHEKVKNTLIRVIEFRESLVNVK